jgi:hypothetical protein
MSRDARIGDRPVRIDPGCAWPDRTPNDSTIGVRTEMRSPAFLTVRPRRGTLQTPTNPPPPSRVATRVRRAAPLVLRRDDPVTFSFAIVTPSGTGRSIVDSPRLPRITGHQHDPVTAALLDAQRVRTDPL